MPLLDPSDSGFTKKREVEGHVEAIGGALDDDEGSGRHTGVAHDALRHRFLKRDGQGQRIAERVGDVERLEQGRDLRLADGPAARPRPC